MSSAFERLTPEILNRLKGYLNLSDTVALALTSSHFCDNVKIPDEYEIWDLGLIELWDEHCTDVVGSGKARRALSADDLFSCCICMRLHWAKRFSKYRTSGANSLWSTRRHVSGVYWSLARAD